MKHIIGSVRIYTLHVATHITAKWWLLWRANTAEIPASSPSKGKDKQKLSARVANTEVNASAHEIGPMYMMR